jgi:mono/diheme cytochrome c family protein
MRGEPVIEQSHGPKLWLAEFLLAAFVAHAASNGRATIVAQSSGKSVWDGVYAEEQSKRGEQLSKSSCVSCHGERLAGGDLGPALHGQDFRAVWVGRSAGELFDKIQTTMPADSAGSLKPEQAADLVAYIFKLNDFPVGQTEIGTELPALNEIKIRDK